MHDIEQLQKQKKIRGFIQHRPNNHDSNIEHNKKLLQKASNVSEEKEWLSWNLPYLCNEHCLTLETEYLFDENNKRKFRFDWSIPALKIAIEYNGIMSHKSRHTSITGYSNDMEKMNLAQSQGWVVLAYTPLNYKNVLNDLRKLLMR